MGSNRKEDTHKAGVLSKYPDMLTVPHLCEILHVGKKAIYGMMNRGDLKYARVGKSYVSTKKWLKEYFEKDAKSNLKMTGKYGTIVPVLEFEPVREEKMI